MQSFSVLHDRELPAALRLRSRRRRYHRANAFKPQRFLGVINFAPGQQARPTVH
jgi:hypothetical protein